MAESIGYVGRAGFRDVGRGRWGNPGNYGILVPTRPSIERLAAAVMCEMFHDVVLDAAVIKGLTKDVHVAFAAVRDNRDFDGMVSAYVVDLEVEVRRGAGSWIYYCISHEATGPRGNHLYYKAPKRILDLLSPLDPDKWNPAKFWRQQCYAAAATKRR